MCGRYSLTEGYFHIKTFYGVHLDENFPKKDTPSIENQLLKPRYNIAPTQLALAVTIQIDPQATNHTINHATNHQKNQASLQVMKWGLQPTWSDRGFFNARAETAATKPAFREALKFRRCLIPATHYFEWQQLSPKRKQPYCFQYDLTAMGNRSLMSLAAIYEPGDHSTFSLLTCEPNEAARTIHDRMPVMLHPSQFNEWLDCTGPQALKPSQVVDYLHHLASKENTETHRLISFPVSTRINTAKFDDTELIAPIKLEPNDDKISDVSPKQLRLFEDNE